MDLALVAHLSTLKTRIPFMHFFDGYRTSAQINKINVIPYDEIAKLVPEAAVLQNLRGVALNPNTPIIRGTGQRPDIFMQNAVAAQRYYDAAPALVQQAMDEVGAMTGRQYKLFDYHGHPEADRVVVAMGSSTSTVQEAVDYMNGWASAPASSRCGCTARGTPTRSAPRSRSQQRTSPCWTALVRTAPSARRATAAPPRAPPPPHPLTHIPTPPAALPRRLGVVRARHRRGAQEDRRRPVRPRVQGVHAEARRRRLREHARRAAEAQLRRRHPRRRDDDLARGGARDRHDPRGDEAVSLLGLGTDGTVGANKAAIKTISSNTELFGQGHFAYDSHKGGGVTMSHIRFGPSPHMPEYEIQQGADYIACGNTSYVTKFDMIKTAAPGATFLLNTPWVGDELEKMLPTKMKQTIAERGLDFYTIDATRVAKEVGLGQRINTVMQSAFYHLVGRAAGRAGDRAPQERHRQALLEEGPRRRRDEPRRRRPLGLRARQDRSARRVEDGARRRDGGGGGERRVAPPVRLGRPHQARADGGDERRRDADPLRPHHLRLQGKVPFDDPQIFAEEIMHPVLALEGDDLPVSASRPTRR